ncbi:MAG: helix-turn-helix domain-containing protein [Actinomycetota bacterium]|nr:helix-turn-helix domain-containing protein [Actinomycetota bacterium]
MTHQDSDMTEPLRVTVEDAARLLGVTVDAVRKRIERGSLRSEKAGTTRYVFLDPDMTKPDTDMASPDSDLTDKVTILTEHVQFLRRELEVWQEEARRKDHIIAALTERIPELEPARDIPSEPREPAVTTFGDEDKGPVHTEPEKPSWWRRIFQ